MSDERVVFCRAPKKNARSDGQLCGGFVVRVPWPFRVVGLVRHSARADTDSVVAKCSVCRTSHEVVRLDPAPVDSVK